MYVLYYILGVVAWNGRSTFSNPVTYDQRQTGATNVQIFFKDVKVVALVDPESSEDYEDYDVGYDYADFPLIPIIKPTTDSAIPSVSSVKPWNIWPTIGPNPSPTPTTPKTTKPTNTARTTIFTVPPSQSSIANNVPSEPTTETTIDEVAINVSQSDDSTLNSTIYNLTNLNANNDTNVPLTIGDSGETPKVKDVKTEGVPASVSLEPSPERLKKSCPTGYARNKRGRCRSTHIRHRTSLVPLAMKLGFKMSDKGQFGMRKDLPIRVYKSEPRQ